MILLIRNGQFYHLPTFSNVVATGQDGLWMTEFKGGVLSSEPSMLMTTIIKEIMNAFKRSTRNANVIITIIISDSVDFHRGDGLLILGRLCPVRGGGGWQ